MNHETFLFNVPVVSQFYESQVYDEYVIKGNAAVLKCHLPSFISDHVEIIEWADSDGGQYSYKQDNSGIQMILVLQPFHYIPISYSQFSYQIRCSVGAGTIGNKLQFFFIK